MRSLVQQDMMRPKSATHYTGEMEEIAGEVVANIEAGMDGEGCFEVRAANDPSVFIITSESESLLALSH